MNIQGGDQIASTQTRHLQGYDFERQTVFMRGVLILAIMMSIYIVGQFIGLKYVLRSEMFSVAAYGVSICTTAAVIIALVAIIVAVRRQALPTPNPIVYRYMVWLSITVFVASLIQVHLVGSLNSLHLLLVVTVLLVVSWLLRWRDVVLFYLLGNLGLTLLVALEFNRTLPYAPLFKRNAVLAEIFLDWRVVLGQSVNYLLVLAACTIFIWKLRQMLEASEELRSKTEEALRREIAERTQSENEKAVLIKKLRDSLDQVQTLRGLLPICSGCKSIRDDKGYWTQLESYLSEHAPELEFTHGLCPKCMEKLCPGIHAGDK